MKYLCINPVILQHVNLSVIWYTDGHYYFIVNSPQFVSLEIRNARKHDDFDSVGSSTINRRYIFDDVITLILATEIHYIDSKWYIYLVAVDRTYLLNTLFSYRIYMLENMSMQSWNNFLWPLIVLRPGDKFTLPIGLNTLLSPYGNNYDLLIMGALGATVPIIIVFIFFQQYFIAGLTSGGVKG